MSTEFAAIHRLFSNIFPGGKVSGFPGRKPLSTIDAFCGIF
jgi:hypothetical protein